MPLQATAKKLFLC